MRFNICEYQSIDATFTENNITYKFNHDMGTYNIVKVKDLSHLVTIPDSIVSTPVDIVDSNSIVNLDNLTHLIFDHTSLSNKILFLETGALSNLPRLESISFDRSVVLDSNAIKSCPRLKIVRFHSNLPSTLQQSGFSGFWQCPNIEFIYAPADQLKFLETQMRYYRGNKEINYIKI